MRSRTGPSALVVARGGSLTAFMTGVVLRLSESLITSTRSRYEQFIHAIPFRGIALFAALLERARFGDDRRP